MIKRLIFIITAILAITIFIVILNLSGSSRAITVPSLLQTGIQAGQPIDDGGNILITDDVAVRMAQTGALWVRVNFRLGPYDSDTSQFYKSYDTVVANLLNHGLQVVGLISNESWRGNQSDWTANSYERTKKDGYNTYIDQFGYAFARIAKHWEGKITYWEIWNEPNAYRNNPKTGVYEGGSYIYPSNFAAMLAHTYSQVNYYNHIKVKIITGGLFGHNIAGYNAVSSGSNYLNSTYDMGVNKTGKFAWAKSVMGTYPLDFVGQHIYLDQGDSLNTLQFSRYLNYVHNVMTKWENVSKNTWITEFGWDTKLVDENLQSDNLKKAMSVLKAKNYVTAAIWFQLDDNPGADMRFGIYRADLSKKPAWTNFYTDSIRQINAGRTAIGTTITKIANYYNVNGGLAVNGRPYDNGGSIWAHYWDFGYVQDFKGGSIGQNAIFSTGYRVQRDFLKTYLTGNNHLTLKFPKSDEYAYGAGTRQDFQGGYMIWDAVNNVKIHLY